MVIQVFDKTRSTFTLVLGALTISQLYDDVNIQTFLKRHDHGSIGSAGVYKLRGWWFNS